MKESLLVVLLLVLTPSVVFAQSTPDELADMLVTAINSESTSTIEKLFHPSTVDYYSGLSADALGKQVDILSKKKMKKDYTVQVTPVEKVEAYDLSGDTYTLFNIPMKFAKRPDMKLDIDQTKVQKNKADQKNISKEQRHFRNDY